jgi:hypothetical protein
MPACTAKDDVDVPDLHRPAYFAARLTTVDFDIVPLPTGDNCR